MTPTKDKPVAESAPPVTDSNPDTRPVPRGPGKIDDDTTFGGVYQRPDESNAEFGYRQDFMSNW